MNLILLRRVALTQFGANLGLVWQTSPFPLCVGYNKLVQSPLTAQWMRWRIFYLKDHSIKNLRKSEENLKLDLAAQEIKNSYPATSDFYFFSASSDFL